MKKILASVLAIVMAISLAACGGSPSTPADPSAPDSQGAGNTTTADKPVTVIYSVGEDYVSIDQVGNNNVQTYTINPMIFDKYIYSDYAGKIEGGMFTDWSANEDSTEWTFTLREGMKFHDGDPVLPEDVEFTWELWVGENELSTKNSLWTALEDVEVKDGNKVVFHFSAPQASFVYSLPRYGGDLINKSVYETMTREEYFNNPIGVGPFKFVSWTPGGDMVLQRNDDWYGADVWGMSNVDTFIFRYIGEDTTRLSALETGEIDIIRDIPAEQMDHVASLSGIKLETGDAWTLGMTGFTCGEGRVFNDMNARLAAWYGIDRQLICDTILGGGHAYYWPVPAGCDGYDEALATDAANRYGYDLEKAKEYLAASSYNGEEITVIEPSGAFPRNDEVLQAMVAMWEQVGFKVNLQIMDRTAFNTTRSDGKYDIYVHSNSTAQDTLNWAYYHVVQNVGHYDYDNPELVAKVNEAHSAETRDSQIKALTEAYAMMTEVIAPDSMWFTLENRCAYKDNISGFTLNPDQTFDFKTIRVN